MWTLTVKQSVVWATM